MFSVFVGSIHCMCFFCTLTAEGWWAGNSVTNDRAYSCRWQLFPNTDW